MTNKRSRKWLITQNNPDKYNLNHNFIMIILSSLNPDYACMCDEIGEEGTYHTHIFIQFKNARSFSKIKEAFPFAHIDKVLGSSQENRDYIRKEGKYLNSDKKETNLIDTFKEFGEMIPEKQGKRNDLEDILYMIKEGSDEIEIIEKHPSFMNNLGSYDRVKGLYVKEESSKWRFLEITYIYGDTGSGKTRYIYDTFGIDNVFRVTNYNHPFDKYDYEDVIVFDEFRSSIPLSDMLVYLDGHPVPLPCRYNDKYANYTKVFIISNIPLKMQYYMENIDLETKRAFERRINKVIHFIKGKEPREEDVRFAD